MPVKAGNEDKNSPRQSEFIIEPTKPSHSRSTIRKSSTGKNLSKKSIPRQSLLEFNQASSKAIYPAEEPVIQTSNDKRFSEDAETYSQLKALENNVSSEELPVTNEAELNVWPLDEISIENDEELELNEENIRKLANVSSTPSCLPRVKEIMGDYRPNAVGNNENSPVSTILHYNVEKVAGTHHSNRHPSHGRLTVIRSDMVPAEPSQSIFIQEEHLEWEMLTKIRANEAFNITKYKSKDTGLHVVHASIASPTVHTYFIISMCL